MPKYAHPDILDGGANVIVAAAGTAGRVKQHLITAYTAGDSYATVISNSVASYDMVSGDFSQATNGSNGRELTIGAKSGNNASASSGATPDLHQAIVDSTNSKVWLVTDETTDQVITSGNPVNLGTFKYTVAQPT